MTEIAPDLPEPLILISPDTLPRAPVFNGTRIPIQAHFDCIAGGAALTDFLDDFPHGSQDHAMAVLELARTRDVGTAAASAAAATDPARVER